MKIDTRKYVYNNLQAKNKYRHKIKKLPGFRSFFVIGCDNIRLRKSNFKVTLYGCLAN